jgi:hypothetical protein
MEMSVCNALLVTIVIHSTAAFWDDVSEMNVEATKILSLVKQILTVR